MPWDRKKEIDRLVFVNCAEMVTHGKKHKEYKSNKTRLKREERRGEERKPAVDDDTPDDFAAAIASSPVCKMEVPEDVVRDILSMLPVKSLLRFKCVCKHWCALITNPSFIALHLSRASLRSKSDYLVVNRSNLVDGIRKGYLSIHSDIESLDRFQMYEDFDLPFFKDTHFLLLLSSSNGILCVTDNWNQTVLINPATREFKELPIPSFTQPNHLGSYTVAMGFGFDPKTSDYKVVRILEFFEEDPRYSHDSYKTQVYNLSSNSWRQLETIVPADVFHMPCFDLLFNGAWHWYAQNGRYNEWILSFHISDEVFQKMQFPGICLWSDECHRSLTVLNESLALIIYKDSRGWPALFDKQFDIWVMGEYGVKESWTLLCKIGPLSIMDQPLAFWKDNELLLQTSEGQLVSCNLHDQNVKRFQVYGLPESLQVAIYSESLVLINSKDDITEESSDNDLHVVN